MAMVTGTVNFVSLILICNWYHTVVNACWNAPPVFLVTHSTRLLMGVIPDGALQYRDIILSHQTPECHCMLAMQDGHVLTWQVCTASHWVVCGLHRPLSHNVPWLSSCGLAGPGAVHYLLKKVDIGIGSTLYICSSWFVFPSVKVGHLLYLYLYIVYIMHHPCCVAICIHIQYHKPHQDSPKVASAMMIGRR